MGTGTSSSSTPDPWGTSGDPGGGGGVERAQSSSSGSVVWLLMPHLSLALVILSLLFTDFLLYRRRVRVLQKRAFDKQELVDTFPKRVIAGLYRNIPSSRNATPMHAPTPRKTLNATTITTDTTSTNTSTKLLESAAGVSQGREKKASKKKQRLESAKSSTATSSDSLDVPEAVSKPITNGGLSSSSRRRLEKRESCRKLPPLQDSRDSSAPNGFVQKEDRRLSPLLDEGEREDLSMA